MTNTARIEKARKQYQKLFNSTGDRPSTIFTKAIQDNIPPQISVEAVEELREKYKCWDNPSERCIIDDLNILLSQQQQDGN